jgi:hypothetical protein
VIKGRDGRCGGQRLGTSRTDTNDIVSLLGLQIFPSISFQHSYRHAHHPSPQPSLSVASTNSSAHVFRRWHWFRSDETSPVLVPSGHHPAGCIVSCSSCLGRSGRCYAGTGQYSRLRWAFWRSRGVALERKAGLLLWRSRGARAWFDNRYDRRQSLFLRQSTSS